MSKILTNLVIFSLIVTSTSIWYYFIVFLPWIEKQKMEILQKNETRKQQYAAKLNECFESVNKRYLDNRNLSCEYHKKNIESCKNNIDENYKQCLNNDDAQYERCRAKFSPWIFPDMEKQSVKAYCWKNWCTKTVCEEYKEENWICFLPRDEVLVLDWKKSADIAWCKEQYSLNISDSDSTIIKQEQTIEIQR